MNFLNGKRTSKFKFHSQLTRTTWSGELKEIQEGRVLIQIIHVRQKKQIVPSNNTTFVLFTWDDNNNKRGSQAFLEPPPVGLFMFMSLTPRPGVFHYQVHFSPGTFYCENYCSCWCGNMRWSLKQSPTHSRVSRLRFSVRWTSTLHFIVVTSTHVINMKIVNYQVEARWGSKDQWYGPPYMWHDKHVLEAIYFTFLMFDDYEALAENR